MNSNRHVQRLYAIQERLKAHHGTGLSWRQIAALKPFQGVSPGTLCAIAKGRDPKDPEIRRILGLPEIITIQVKRDRKGKFEK